MVQPDRRMHFACWIPKAADTHSEYAPLIAFAQKQWLPKRASMLRLKVSLFLCLVLYV
jgi:hypothetical protein